MEHLEQIDILKRIAFKPSEADRKKSNIQRQQKEKEEGYQQLNELCHLGEYDAAKRLANQNFHWGYEIVEGVVTERVEF